MTLTPEDYQLDKRAHIQYPSPMAAIRAMDPLDQDEAVSAYVRHSLAHLDSDMLPERTTDEMVSACM